MGGGHRRMTMTDSYRSEGEDKGEKVRVSRWEGAIEYLQNVLSKYVYISSSIHLVSTNFHKHQTYHLCILSPDFLPLLLRDEDG